MFDLRLTSKGDLAIGPEGDVSTTDSVAQAVSVRLRWFIEEWRLGPTLGFPYFEEVFVKNPNLTKIKYLLRDLIMEVDGVTNGSSMDISVNAHTREATIKAVFAVEEDVFTEEVKING